MIKHHHLLKYATDEDDYPVFFYVCEAKVDTHWTNARAAEVLYVPEQLFRHIADEFIDYIGEDAYHGKTLIEGNTQKALERAITKEWHEAPHKAAADEILIFIKQCSTFITPHFIRFEGP